MCLVGRTVGGCAVHLVGQGILTMGGCEVRLVGPGVLTVGGCAVRLIGRLVEEVLVADVALHLLRLSGQKLLRRFLLQAAT